MDKIYHRVSQGNFRTPGYKKEKIPPKLLERENSSLNRGIENQTALDFSAAKLKYRDKWDQSGKISELREEGIGID